MTTINDSLDFILGVKPDDEAEILINGIGSFYSLLGLILNGVDEITDDLNFILNGKTYDEINFILNTRIPNECNFLIKAAPPTLIIYDFIEKELEDFELTSDTLINEVTVRYNYDPAEGKFLSAITKHNPLSKLLYREEKSTYELKMIGTTRQAEIIADAVLLSFSIPEIISSFSHDLRSLFIELGDLITLTHSYGLGETGYNQVPAEVIKKDIDGLKINYAAVIKEISTLYQSELVNISQVSSSGAPSITIQYEAGVATITIYAEVAGNPPIEGANVLINGIKKITDKKGQARFNLEHGTYIAQIQASGYEDAEIQFKV